MTRADIKVEGVAQALRGLQEEGIALHDVTADVIRQAAVRERHVVIPLEHHDVGVLLEAAQSSGRGHPPATPPTTTTFMSDPSADSPMTTDGLADYTPRGINASAVRLGR